MTKSRNFKDVYEDKVHQYEAVHSGRFITNHMV